MAISVKNKEKLASIIQKFATESYPQNSRIHLLPSWSSNSSSVFVKREDELGFGANGSKLRKYLSLIPHIASQKEKEVALYGNAFSNHILSMVLLLNEKKIPYTLFLEGPKAPLQGNFLYTALATPSNKILWNVSLDPKSYEEEIRIWEKKLGKSFYWVPMGASCKESLPGALTLAFDILRNEEQLGKSFDRIFIDSGTGFTAASLVAAFHYLQKKTKIHVIHIGGDEKDFSRQLQLVIGYLSNALEEKLSFPTLFDVKRPKVSRSFGSVSSKLFQFIMETARSDGLVLDPIYNGKLFYEAKQALLDVKTKGNSLIIHSGGALTLCGFQEKLSAVLKLS